MENILLLKLLFFHWRWVHALIIQTWHPVLLKTRWKPFGRIMEEAHYLDTTISIPLSILISLNINSSLSKILNLPILVHLWEFKPLYSCQILIYKQIHQFGLSKILWKIKVFTLKIKCLHTTIPSQTLKHLTFTLI